MESSQDPPPFPPQRTRARSNSIRGENPLETPISPADHQLARLGASINVHNARRQSTSLASRSEFQQAVGAAVNASREDEERSRQRRAALITSGGYSGLPIRSGAQRSSDSESGFCTRSKLQSISSITDSGIVAPQSEPFERSKTPTQDDYRAQQSANSRDLLPGNRAFRVNSLQRPQYPSLVGTQTQPQARAKSSSASDQGRSNAPLPALQRGQQTYPLSRPPIPTLVERPFVLQGRPAQSNPSGSSSSVSSLPNPQPNLRQDFPVRHISHITPNPARQTPQVSTPIGLHPGRSASVGHWIPHDRTNPSFGEAFPSFTDDSGFEETTVEKGEPFPSFEEPSATEDVFPRYQEASNPERGTTAQGSESQEPSSIGRLIAKDRARSSSGSDSDDSDRTVIYRGPARESVNTLRLPIETDYIIFCVYNNLSFLLPKHLTHPVLFSEGSAREEISIAESDPFILASMSFQNYVDQPSGGAGSNPRQAPTSPSQGAPHTNGMNGGMGMGGGMVGYPTPAGHQSDLNYLMNMVEELSGVLALNQRLTNGVVEKMGKVREKAQNMNLSNDELLQLAAMELNGKNFHPPHFSHILTMEKTDRRTWSVRTLSCELPLRNPIMTKRRISSLLVMEPTSSQTLLKKCTHSRSSMRQTRWLGTRITASNLPKSARRT